ncbi:hypothetical protein VTH06DRAFT_256 [Thermothelomyces fergusii]
MPSPSSLFGFLAPKPPPPPYNKMASLNMTVEVQTVEIQPGKGSRLPVRSVRADSAADTAKRVGGRGKAQTLAREGR